MSEGGGIFSSALRRLAGGADAKTSGPGGAPAHPPGRVFPGAVKTAVRGAAYPPLLAPPPPGALANPSALASITGPRGATTTAPRGGGSSGGGEGGESGGPPSPAKDPAPSPPRHTEPEARGAASPSRSASATAEEVTKQLAEAALGEGLESAPAPVAPAPSPEAPAAPAAQPLPGTPGYDRARDPVLAAPVRGSLRAPSAPGPWGDGHLPYASPVRTARFKKLLEARSVDVDTLRRLAWSGVPACYRTCTWQTLLGYLPISKERQATSLAKKKTEYQSFVASYFMTGASGRSGAKSEAEQALWRQVLVDVPRTAPGIPLLHTDFVQRSLERVLYVWALRHPASGYVQGINDLATPFYAVFLSPWADLESSDLSPAVIDPSVLADIEADVYWCLTRMLDGIQDHYTPSQPGIQRMIFRLRELVHRIDEALVVHLESNGVEFHTFAFRWANCLLLRELPFPLVLRLWDTCIAEDRHGFDSFYVYICAALLLQFSAKVKALRFQEMVQFLQKLPTREWGVRDLEELLSQAYVYKESFDAAPSHLT